MKRGWQVIIGLGATTFVAGGAIATPHALRSMVSFEVRRVEVRGTRYLAPHEALRASGITRASNVFQDYSAWRSALERLALVDSVVIERELPGTLRLTIAEAEPIALLARTELQALNVEGELLPIDPTRVDLDLPVISASEVDEDTRSALRTLAAIKKAEPAMYGWVSDVEPMGTGIRVRLRSPVGAEALLPPNPGALQLRELRLTLADLAARQEISRLVRIDARYRDQIVVRLSRTAAL